MIGWLARAAAAPRYNLLMQAACWALLASSCSPARADDNAAEDKPLPPEQVELLTNDGVKLVATWYPSRHGEEACPIILLHGYKGNRGEFHELALYLQREKRHAVIVPDLRGHGESTTITPPDASPRPIEAGRLQNEDFERMVMEDLETVKRFLVRKNNARQLNIERLGIVGAEMGAAIAMEWAFYDWDADRLVGVKQGRDVKALVLLSPDTKFKSLGANSLTEEPIAGQISLDIVVGAKSPKAVKNAQHVLRLVERFYPDPPRQTPEDIARREQRLFVADEFPTSLQGAKLLNQKLGVEQQIADFFDLRLVKQPYVWRLRKSPL